MRPTVVGPLPWVDVTNYGTVGDGVADDLPAFEAALAALGDSGELRIPDGHYWFSDSLNIDKEWIRVVCAPGALIETTNTVTSSGGHAVAFTGYGNLGTDTTPQREYAEWVGGSVQTNIAGSNENALGALRYKQVRVSNLTVPTCGRKAFTAQYGVDDVIVDGLRVGHSGNASVSIEESCNRVTLRNLSIEQSDRWALYVVDGVTHVSIDNVDVGMCVDALLYARDVDRLHARNLHCADVSAGHGIHLVDMGGDVRISDFDIATSTSGWFGVYAQSGSGRLSIRDGFTTGCTSANVAGAWTRVALADITAEAVPAGQDMIVFASLTTRPTLHGVYGSGTAHRYTINATSMSGYEPVLMGCNLPTGASGKYGNWKPKVELVVSSLSLAATKDFGSIAANTTSELTFSLPGAVLGDEVIATPTTSGLEAGLMWSAYVSATDVVTLRLANTTASAIDPGSRVWKVRVFTPA